MNNDRNKELLSFLRRNGPTPSGQLTEHLGISRATLSRRVRSLGNRIVTIGKGRTTQLAARHESVPEENREAWLRMYPLAVEYWKRVAREADISEDFRKIADEALTSIQNTYRIGTF